MYCGKEFHGYLNDDGTYRIRIISTATKEEKYGYVKMKEDTEAVIDIPKAKVSFEVFPDNESDNKELWTLVI